jgi:hypothetical protein
MDMSMSMSMDMDMHMDMFLQQYDPLLLSPLPFTTSPQVIDYFSFGKDKDAGGVPDYFKSSTAGESQGEPCQHAQAQGQGQGQGQRQGYEQTQSLEGKSDAVAGNTIESNPKAATTTAAAPSGPASPDDKLMPPPPLFPSHGDHINGYSASEPKDSSSKASTKSPVTPSSLPIIIEPMTSTSTPTSTSPKDSQPGAEESIDQTKIRAQTKNESETKLGSKPNNNHNHNLKHNLKYNLAPPATSTAFDSLQDFPFPYQPTPLDPEIERFLNSYFPNDTFSNGFAFTNSNSANGSGSGLSPISNSNTNSNSNSNPTPGFENYLNIPEDTPGMMAAHGMVSGGGRGEKGMIQDWAHASGQGQGYGFEKASPLSTGSGSASGTAGRPGIPTDFLSRVLSFSWDDLGNFCTELENR